MTARRDYRQARLSGREVWHTPANAAATAALDRIFADLADGTAVRPEAISVRGRTIDVPAAARGVARFGFDDLCRAALGPEDYLAIAARYHTVVIDGVPVMDEAMRNEARRFITLVDALYERKTRLAASADAMPEALVTAGSHVGEYRRTASRLAEMRSDGWVSAERRRPA